MTITLRGVNGSCALHSSGCDTFYSLFTVCFGKGSVDLPPLKSETKFSFLSEVRSLDQPLFLFAAKCSQNSDTFIKGN